ncbi:hypothetical protein N7468_003861 [Penicillium chermesinum]|uniref:Uncharacterized protein n=1 Tax=Penicillium chermesinum TaxID=63820 RepID=A0A9W9TS74_9EURO|nr:uncharacterized protein N7468_003861 [Penicillium chermesinum]KAJ5239242.1 hypothetical protein N7468_003861 [Penicillium chermesinum]KAJ6164873.1 hypothetical protein N7470_003545 [Penicillium chermesinum]
MDLADPTIELTPLESTLRTLLLDVAEYVQHNEVADGASDAAKKAETVLRFTGGWVRDKLLGIESHDIDVGISNMTGYQFGMALKEYLDQPERLEKYKKSLPNEEMSDAIVSLHKIEANPEKSKHLETVTTKIFGLDIDLVNLRKETYTDDSRNPQMEFGTAVEDALRRDATINALFYNLNESKLEDFTERGLDDMRKKIVRTPLEPYQTFKDDPLRVLRLIRFASRLGYKIDPEAEIAMRNEDISVALKLKISHERVGTELDKMLRGPDPRGALEFIDKIGLYPTIFANQYDDIMADTSKWYLAYNGLARFLSSDFEEDKGLRSTVVNLRKMLVGDDSLYAWMIATFSPWAPIPARTAQGKKGPPQRCVEIARDGLRCDNKSLTVLRDAALHYEDIIKYRTAIQEKSRSGSMLSAEDRQQTGLNIRKWGKDWKLCVLSAILQEIIQGHDFPEVMEDYSHFIQYILDERLEDAYDLKPILNGDDIKTAFNAKPGPWMSKVTAAVIEWQLLHPDGSKDAALEEITRRRKELGF